MKTETTPQTHLEAFQEATLKELLYNHSVEEQKEFINYLKTEIAKYLYQELMTAREITKRRKEQYEYFIS